MSHRVLSPTQMAEHIRNNGGGSFDWNTGETAEGPGYMVAAEGAEEKLPKKISGKDISKFMAKHSGLADTMPSTAYSGFWGGGRGTTADVSTKISRADEAREYGNAQKQEAAFALPGTEVQPDTKIEDVANPWGGDVLLNMRQHGLASLGTTPENPEHWGDHEVQNESWNEVGGKSRIRVGRGEGPLKRAKNVTLEDVYRQINKGRADRLREGTE